MNKKIASSILALILIVFSITACGVKGETPEKSVEKALGAIKNVDVETAKKYFNYDELMNYGEGNPLEGYKMDANSEEYAKMFFSKLNCKIVSSSTEGETAMVKAEITNLDMKTILGEYFAESMKLAFQNAFNSDGEKINEEDMKKQVEEKLVALLKKPDNKTVTTTVDIKLKKNDKAWTIEMDEKLKDAILGGLVSGMKELSESLMTEMNMGN